MLSFYRARSILSFVDVIAGRETIALTTRVECLIRP